MKPLLLLDGSILECKFPRVPFVKKFKLRGSLVIESSLMRLRALSSSMEPLVLLGGWTGHKFEARVSLVIETSLERLRASLSSMKPLVLLDGSIFERKFQRAAASSKQIVTLDKL